MRRRKTRPDRVFGADTALDQYVLADSLRKSRSTGPNRPETRPGGKDVPDGRPCQSRQCPDPGRALACPAWSIGPGHQAVIGAGADLARSGP